MVMSSTRFPTVRWGESEVTFRANPGDVPPGNMPAVVVFAIHKNGFVVAYIPDRGWCVPSGRLEPGETPIEAAIRETAEESGAELLDVTPIGTYFFSDSRGELTYVPAFIGRIASLGPLPKTSESLGVRIVTRGELPSCYWRWDALMEAMFDYAASEAARLLPGISI